MRSVVKGNTSNGKDKKVGVVRVNVLRVQEPSGGVEWDIVYLGRVFVSDGKN